MTVACDVCMETGRPLDGAVMNPSPNFPYGSGQWIICARCYKNADTDQVKRDVITRRQAMDGQIKAIVETASDADLAILYMEDGLSLALDELIDRRMGLIYSVARPWIGRTAMDEDDLLHEAVIGFIQGVRTFDNTKGVLLTTHCTWTMKKVVSDAVRDFNEVSVGHDTFWHIRKLERVEGELIQELARFPTDEELVHAMNTNTSKQLSITDVIEIRRAALDTEGTMSLDEPFEGEEGHEIIDLHDIIPSDVNIEEDYMKKELIMQALEGVNDLPDEQREVIQLRYFEGYTWEEVEEAMQISRRTAVRREAEALATLGALLQA